MVGRTSIQLVWFFFLLPFFMDGKPTITLRVQTPDGAPANQVAIGQPLLIEIAITGIGAEVPHYTINGLDQTSSRRTSFHLATVNGLSMLQSTYTIFYQQVGTHQLGPVTASIGGVSISSPMVSIEVVADTAGLSSVAPQKKKLVDQVTLESTVIPIKPFVRQKINGTITLRAPRGYITFQQLTQEGTMPFAVTYKKNAKQWVQEIQGKEYDCVEWQWEGYQSESGPVLIPAYCAQVSSTHAGKKNKNMPFFWHYADKKKSIYSAAIPFEVQALPATVPADTVVGELKHFSACVYPACINQSQAATLQLELAGDVCFDAIEMKPQYDEQGLKIYPSKQYLVDSNVFPLYKAKRFEYVVQGLQEGEWEIPAQELHYFSPKTARMEIIKTEPVIITVTKSVESLPDQKTPPALSAEQIQQAEKSSVSDDGVLVNALVTDSNWSLPWYLFFFIFFLPIGALGGCVLSNWYQRYSRYHHVSLPVIQKQILAAKQRNDCTLLPVIIRSFIHQRMLMRSSPAPIEDEDRLVEEQLTLYGLSREALQEWHTFWLQMHECVFGVAMSTRMEHIFDQALFWVSVLDKAL